MFALLIFVREDSICSRSSVQHETLVLLLLFVCRDFRKRSEFTLVVGVLADLVYVQLSSPALGRV